MASPDTEPEARLRATKAQAWLAHSRLERASNLNFVENTKVHKDFPLGNLRNHCSVLVQEREHLVSPLRWDTKDGPFYAEFLILPENILLICGHEDRDRQV